MIDRRAFLIGTGGAASLAALGTLPRLARAAEAKGGIVIAIGKEPDTLDPTQAINPPIVMASLVNIFESLMPQDIAGNPTEGAAKWEISPDGLSVTYRIKPGVKFHSGDALTADDVVFAHTRSAAKNPSYKRYLRTFDHIEKVDGMTVRYHFKRPSISFLKSTGPALVSKAYFDRVGEAVFVKQPNGIGPYRFQGYTTGVALDVEAFPDYYGKKPAIPAARFRFVGEATTRVAMLKAGEADLVMDTPTTEVAPLAKAGFRNVETLVHPSVSIQFSFADPKAPWADRRVRLALAEAVDCQGIVNQLFNGVPQRWPRLAPDELGYDPTLKNYPYDPADARRLLKEAGYPNGFTMPLYYLTGSYAGLKETAEAVVLFFRQVGVKAEVKPVDAPTFVQTVRRAKKDASFPFVAVSPMPMAHFADPADTLAFALYGKSPFSVFGDPKSDKLIEEAGATVNDEERAKYIRAAFKIIHQDIPSFTIWNQVEVYTMKKALTFEATKKGVPMLQLWNVGRA
jgi:peptide/nickel transport system substrate-binding protein